MECLDNYSFYGIIINMTSNRRGRKKFVKKNMAAGLCEKCINKWAPNSKRYCAKHLNKLYVRIKAKRQRYLLANRCVDCGTSPIDPLNKYYCQRCRLKRLVMLKATHAINKMKLAGSLVVKQRPVKAPIVGSNPTPPGSK